MSHDPLCACQQSDHRHAFNTLGEDCLYCDCDRIAEIRADEQRLAAERRAKKFGVWHDVERSLP